MIELFSPEPTPEEMSDAAALVASNNVLARGPEVLRFEEALGETLQTPHVIAASSGTAALHMAVRALGWDSGDKILTSPYSFIATSNVLLHEGCTPVYGRINSGLQLDLEHAATVIDDNPDIKGILVPHIFGHQVDTEDLKELRLNFPHIQVIEDAAQALAPGKYNLGVGVHSDIVAYSFHENKVISTFGEGGAVTTRDLRLAQKLRALREHGRIDAEDWIEKLELGYNYRLTEVQAALGSLQVARLDSILSRRRAIAEYMLSGYQDCQAPNIMDTLC
jgi:perosamine synthetase